MTIFCAECGVSMSLADAEFAVETDAGPVHRECFEGPMPVGMELSPEDEEALEHAEAEAEGAAR